MNKKFVIPLLEGASVIAKQYFRKIKGTNIKAYDGNQVLTEADLAVSKFLLEAVEKSYPDHNIIDEEAGIINHHSEYTWVFDPIDGTSNFGAGIPTYGIIVGLLKDFQPLIGAIALPEFGEIYYGEVGQGAYCNDQQIRITTETNLKKLLVSWGIDGHPEDRFRMQQEMQILHSLLDHILNFRSNNSVFDACMFFRGAIGADLHKDTKIWEAPALQVLAQETGAEFTSFEGKRHDYSNILTEPFGTRYSFCMANKSVHQQVQKLIQQHLPL